MGNKMKCMLCGTENQDEAKRCIQCAASLDTTPGDLLKPRAVPSPTVLVTGTGAISIRGTRNTKNLSIAPLGGSVEQNQMNRDSNSSRKTVYISPNTFGEKAVQTESNESNSSVDGLTLLPMAPIVGFIVTYTWNTSGDSHPIRQGKNIIGSSPKCDFSLSADNALSGEHFAILARGDRVKVKDLHTTNATSVNGTEIWGDAIDVTSGCKIIAGDTTFILVLITSASL